MVKYYFLGIFFPCLMYTALNSFDFQSHGERRDEYQIYVNNIIYNVTLSLVTRELLSQSQATDICRSKKRFHLPVFYSLWEHKRFLDSLILKNTKMTKFWLPQTRTPFKDGYLWMDLKQHSNFAFSFCYLRSQRILHFF